MQKKIYWYGNENLILSNIISDLTGYHLSDTTSVPE